MIRSYSLSPVNIHIYIYIYIYIYPTRCNVTQFILSGNCSTYFGWYLYPSSGAQTTVSTASGICHTVTATCRYRGRVGTGLSVLWVASDSGRIRILLRWAMNVKIIYSVHSVNRKRRTSMYDFIDSFSDLAMSSSISKHNATTYV